jgi:sec-independent protein translocase protein TatA
MGIFGNTFGLPHLILILVIVLLLFGAPKLPGLARSLGQSMKIFRSEIKDPDKAEPVAVVDDASETEEKPVAKSASAARPKSKPKP